VLSALPQLTGESQAQSSGVAVMAHIAGFIAGALLARPFAGAALRQRASSGSW
jgi:membrane associated rhomboid family serine protease